MYNGVIIPHENFEKEIRKIKDLKLSENIPSDEVSEYIKQKLIKYKCSDTMINKFFEWAVL